MDGKENRKGKRKKKGKVRRNREGLTGFKLVGE